ncbi:maltokinase N-terminal cap-like domain-containing protein [Streptantibioticus silvisoli]|uniref:1,4-alpha-glucan branching protein n=1 Tax=Streptantibioticus silvisoli TaxID=2705255 RepID=A0ABT6W7F9_9ACTN|nr:1,4-alpha-glucan branching protein [Streptantibioticus silvisoli]MDI5965613.1 1,4-alpha-glucan branching protein [Streptantibioticus silvisoli]
MAVIHRTTMSPNKLELLTSWLPGRPWYAGGGREPVLGRGGGFRLDDPAGEVGIEFFVATDGSGERPVPYLVPLSYRGAPLDGAEHALIGTSEHGVLGTRWVYDGTHDPVLLAQLLAFVGGGAEAQAQSVSDTPDPSVGVRFTAPDRAAAVGGARVDGVTDGPHGTDVAVTTDSGPLVLRFERSPLPEGHVSGAEGLLGHVTLDWTLPDGTGRRGHAVTVREPAGA